MAVLVSNPLLSALNLTISSSQVVATAPTSANGLTVQGSMIVNQNSKQVQATNSTSGQQVTAYQVDVYAFNFTGLLLLIVPWAVYAYSVSTEKSAKTLKKKKSDSEKAE
jgi:hypothetical protein